MKRIGKVLLTGILGIILLTGCEITKNTLSTDGFIKIAEDNEMVATDVKENQFSEYDIITHATIAQHPSGWQIEFYELTSVKEAKNMFSRNKLTFEKKEEENTKKTKIEVGNYTKYIQENQEEYMVLTRVDNTLLYADVKMEYKEEVDSFIESLGY